jgi:hypothetical protein
VQPLTLATVCSRLTCARGQQAKSSPEQVLLSPATNPRLPAGNKGETDTKWVDCVHVLSAQPKAAQPACISILPSLLLLRMQLDAGPQRRIRYVHTC